MHRIVITALTAMFVAVLPVWSFNEQWTYGPAIAVGFLLGINIVTLAVDRLGRREEEKNP